MRNLKTFSALTTAALSLTLAASAGAAAPTVVKVGSLPGTPAKYNKVFISKYGPSSAKKVLLLIPGTNGGAENFALVGAELAKKVPGLQVWAMDRREQALEDNSMMQKVLANKAPLLRVDLHPSDLDDSRAVDSFERIFDRARDRRTVSFGELVDAAAVSV